MNKNDYIVYANKKLNKCIKIANKLLENSEYYQYINKNDISIIINSKLKTTFGEFLYRIRYEETNAFAYNFTINISLKVILDYNTDALINTILHEYCHWFDYCINGESDVAHSRQWFQIAENITKLTGYKIEEYATECKVRNIYNKYFYQQKYNYYLKCNRCGEIRKITSKFDNINKINLPKECKLCSIRKKIQDEKNVEWDIDFNEKLEWIIVNKFGREIVKESV